MNEENWKDPPAPEPKTAEGYLARVEALRARNDLDGALADIEEALLLEPRNPAAFYHRAGVFLARRDYDRAIRDYDECVRLAPDSHRARFNRAIAYLQAGDPRSGLPDYDAAITMAPGCAMYYTNRGCAHLELGDGARAGADFDKALSIDPNDVFAWFGRARLRLLQGGILASIRECHGALRVRSDFAPARALLDEIASGSWNRSFVPPDQKDSSAPWIGAARFAGLFVLSDRDRAEWVERHVQGHREAERLRAARDASGGKPGPGDLPELVAAERAGLAAVRAAPTDPTAHARYADALSRISLYRRAIEAWGEVIRLAPSAKAYTERAGNLAVIGEFAKAQADFDEAIRLAPLDADLYYRRGCNRTSLGEAQKAADDFVRALAIDPAHAKTLETLKDGYG